MKDQDLVPVFTVHHLRAATFLVLGTQRAYTKPMMDATTQLIAALAGSIVSASAQCSNFLGSCSGVELRFLGDNSGGKAYSFFDMNSEFTNRSGDPARSDERVFVMWKRNKGKK
ncbi:hypothetical protein MY11210_007140 [Beauveria gryllotalpidicola]